MSVNVRPTDKQGGGMSTHTPNAPDDTNIIEICSAAGPLVTIKPNGAIEYGEGYTPDGAATIFWQAIAQAFPALRSESGRAGVIEEILTGLRSEDDSTQLRAIIASIEALKPAAGNEGTVRVPREPTMGQWDDFCAVHHVPFDKFIVAYKAMLAAALSGGRS
jgi:hypothetical protein